MYRRLAPVGHALAVQRPPVPTCGWGPATAGRSCGRAVGHQLAQAEDGSGEHGTSTTRGPSTLRPRMLRQLRCPGGLSAALTATRSTASASSSSAPIS